MKSRTPVLLGAIALMACADEPSEPTRLSPRLSDRGVVEYLDFEPTAVAWMDDSIVVLLDAGNTRLVLFDLRHGVRRVLGGEGDGPGEMRLPVAVAVDAETGSILAADARQLRVTRWDRSGAVTGTVSLPAFPLAIHPARNGKAIVVSAGYGADGAGMTEVDPERGAASSTTALFPVAPKLVVAGQGGAPASPFIASARCSADAYAFGNGWNYEIARVSSAGELLNTFGRPGLSAEMPNERDLARYDEGLKRASQGRSVEVAALMRDAIASYRERPKPHFGVGSLAGDGSGRLYVATTRGSGDQTFVDVFDCDGEYRGEMTLRDDVLAMDVRANRLVVVARRMTDEFERLGIDTYDLE